MGSRVGRPAFEKGLQEVPRLDVTGPLRGGVREGPLQHGLHPGGQRETVGSDSVRQRAEGLGIDPDCSERVAVDPVGRSTGGFGADMELLRDRRVVQQADQEVVGGDPPITATPGFRDRDGHRGTGQRLGTAPEC